MHSTKHATIIWTCHSWLHINLSYRNLKLNFFPPNDTIIMVSSWSWSLHKLMGIYVGSLILSDILEYMISALFSCLLWALKSKSWSG